MKIYAGIKAGKYGNTVSAVITASYTEAQTINSPKKKAAECKHTRQDFINTGDLLNNWFNNATRYFIFPIWGKPVPAK